MQPIKNDNIFPRICGISLAIHLAILSLIAVTFSTQEIKTQPFFVFLGPILSHGELAGDLERTLYPSTQLSKNLSSFLGSASLNGNQISLDTKKPSSLQEAKGQKVVIKPVWATETRETPKNPQDLGIASSVPAHEPLKLDIK